MRRLASAAGHLKGIERMVGEGACCIDIIQQLQAVQAALSKVNAMLLDAHLHRCVSKAVKGEDPAKRERMLLEVAAVLAVSDGWKRRAFNMSEKTFTVPTISCGHCVHTIETGVGELAGVRRVEADQHSKRVTVAWDEPATWEQIRKTLVELNYPPEALIQIG